jgi:hypothetical protein
LIDELENALKKETSNGNLEEAVKLKNAIAVLKSQAGAAGDANQETGGSVKTHKLLNCLARSLHRWSFRKEGLAHVDACVLSVAGATRRGVQDG